MDLIGFGRAASPWLMIGEDVKLIDGAKKDFRHEIVIPNSKKEHFRTNLRPALPYNRPSGIRVRHAGGREKGTHHDYDRPNDKEPWLQPRWKGTTTIL